MTAAVLLTWLFLSHARAPQAPAQPPTPPHWPIGGVVTVWVAPDGPPDSETMVEKAMRT